MKLGDSLKDIRLEKTHEGGGGPCVPSLTGFKISSIKAPQSPGFRENKT